MGYSGLFDGLQTWLFSVKDPMTTADITKMGFTNVVCSIHELGLLIMEALA